MTPSPATDDEPIATILILRRAPEELTRFQDDVIAEDAALVIWQVGTNAIYRSLHEPSVVAGIVATGLSWLKELGPPGPDVILMDL
jgi:hypothetical protein